jgi:hypothetical protein
MNSRTLILSVVSLSAGLLVAGCSSNSSTPAATAAPTPPVSQTTTQADTSQVLGIAQETSEVDTPFVVNGGAFTFTDTSDTTNPIPINTN